MLNTNDQSKPSQAIADHELDGFFAAVAGERAIGLAVSGGADSTALMLLAAGWSERCAASPKIVVLTVDHQLRDGSDEEARSVGDQASKLHLGHEVLTWSGPKPDSDIQAAAREARYRLLAACARERSLGAVLVAHHLDDQAETFLLRLGRGSGVYGLAAMARERMINGVRFVRPFLSVPRARLKATLRTAGMSWIDDPSNLDRRFARIRMRDLLPVFCEEGLSVERLAATADRMRRAAEALDQMVDDALENNAIFHPGGFVGVSTAGFADRPGEIGLRMLARLLMAVGGKPYPPRLEQLEALHDELIAWGGNEPRFKRTLSDVVVEEKAGRFWLYREMGRFGVSPQTLAPNHSALWDRRFDISLASSDQGVAVRPLGADGRRYLGGECRGDWPSAAVETVPSAWYGDKLISVPAFEFSVPAPSCDFSAIWRIGQG